MFCENMYTFMILEKRINHFYFTFSLSPYTAFISNSLVRMATLCLNKAKGFDESETLFYGIYFPLQIFPFGKEHF